MITHHIEQLNHRIAGYTTTSVTSAAISYGGVDPMLQRVAVFVAIISGGLAIVYTSLGIRERWRNRK